MSKISWILSISRHFVQVISSRKSSAHNCRMYCLAKADLCVSSLNIKRFSFRRIDN